MEPQAMSNPLESVPTEDLVAEVCRRMAEGGWVTPPSTTYTPPEGTYPGERTTSPEAADIAHRILDAAERTGLGGCHLCRS
jgi:hypothetical protein